MFELSQSEQLDRKKSHFFMQHETTKSSGGCFCFWRISNFDSLFPFCKIFFIILLRFLREKEIVIESFHGKLTFFSYFSNFVITEKYFSWRSQLFLSRCFSIWFFCMDESFWISFKRRWYRFQLLIALWMKIENRNEKWFLKLRNFPCKKCQLIFLLNQLTSIFSRLQFLVFVWECNPHYFHIYMDFWY